MIFFSAITLLIILTLTVFTSPIQFKFKSISGIISLSIHLPLFCLSPASILCEIARDESHFLLIQWLSSCIASCSPDHNNEI